MTHLAKAIAALVLTALLASSAQAQSPARHGRALLKENCARCHAIGKTGRSPHVGAPPFRMLGGSFDLDLFAHRLTQGIVAGHPDMPEFKFSASDAHAVVTYLREIQK